MDSILIKTLAAVILGFVISAVLGKYLVPALRRWKAGQAIKEDGPTWHMSKQGTPTMGGLMFIAAVAIVVLVLNGPAILSGDLTSVFVLLFALLIIRGYWLALHARDKFGSLIIVGITTLFAFQVFANVAVVTNLFPVTGISLPFFSSGGSALIIQMAEMGLILSISRQNPVT